MSRAHEYDFLGAPKESVSSGIDRLFEPFSETTKRILRNSSKFNRRLVSTKLKSSGLMGTLIHMHLALQGLRIAHHQNQQRVALDADTDSTEEVPAEIPAVVASECTHPSFVAMERLMWQPSEGDWEVFRVEAKMTSIDRAMAGTSDQWWRRRTNHDFDNEVPTLYEYMVGDWKLTASVTDSISGPVLTKMDDAIKRLGMRLFMTSGVRISLEDAYAIVREHCIGYLRDTVHCKRIVQLVAYKVLAEEGGYLPDKDPAFPVRMMSIIGHPSLKNKVRCHEITDYPMGIIDLIFPKESTSGGVPMELMNLAMKCPRQTNPRAQHSRATKRKKADSTTTPTFNHFDTLWNGDDDEDPADETTTLDDTVRSSDRPVTNSPHTDTSRARDGPCTPPTEFSLRRNAEFTKRRLNRARTKAASVGPCDGRSNDDTTQGKEGASLSSNANVNEEDDAAKSTSETPSANHIPSSKHNPREEALLHAVLSDKSESQVRLDEARVNAESNLSAYTNEIKVEDTFHRISDHGVKFLHSVMDGAPSVIVSWESTMISPQSSATPTREQMDMMMDWAAKQDCTAHGHKFVDSVPNSLFLGAMHTSLLLSQRPELSLRSPMQVQCKQYQKMSAHSKRLWKRTRMKEGRCETARPPHLAAYANVPDLKPSKHGFDLERAQPSVVQWWIRLHRPKGSPPVVKSGIMANDPGIRTCTTNLSTRGEVVSFLSAHHGDGKVLEDMAMQVDGIQSRMMLRKDRYGENRGNSLRDRKKRVKVRKEAWRKSGETVVPMVPQEIVGANIGFTHRSRYRMRKAKLRVYRKAKFKTNDAHCKFVKTVTEHATGYMDPRFKSSQMAKCSRRAHPGGLAKSSVRTMMAWSMYKLRDRMKQKARRTPGFLYIDCTEQYTSCTCSECGSVQKSFREEVFNCVNIDCGLVCNRDLNAAKNIIIR